MKIYTKTGDTGDTGLFGGKRVPKDDVRVEAYGSVDELNSLIGLIRSYTLEPRSDAWLESIQNDLFHLGADLATPMDVNSEWVVRLQEAQVKVLESAIDTIENQLDPIKEFILPGGTQIAALLHLARTVCRRAERVCVALSRADEINPFAIVYLNRLSDFLFMLARLENKQAGISETAWSVRS